MVPCSFLLKQYFLLKKVSEIYLKKLKKTTLYRFIILQVRMATALVGRHHVGQADVVVLTQYRLQKFHIEKELEAAGLEDVKVSTVVKSQGNH